MSEKSRKHSFLIAALAIICHVAKVLAARVSYFDVTEISVLTGNMFERSIEYVIGGMYLLALLFAMKEDTADKKSGHVGGVVLMILLANWLAPMFAGSLLTVILAALLMCVFGGILMGFFGSFGSVVLAAFFYLTGTLGSVLLVLLAIGAIVSASLVWGW